MEGRDVGAYHLSVVDSNTIEIIIGRASGKMLRTRTLYQGSLIPYPVKYALESKENV